MTDKSGPKSTPGLASGRKDAHLDLARKTLAEGQQAKHPLEAFDLPYCALPELDLAEIDITARFLHRRLSAPLLITGMTGGTARADALNAALVEVATQHNIAVGLGSQRASLEAGRSQKNLRMANPSACLIGNLGGVQIVGDAGFVLAQRAVEDIEADALAIHLNPLQEAIQPEGDHNWHGVEAAIARLADKLDCPVIVKEVGAGLSPDVVRRLYAAGAAYVDVAAKGGTNWALIEWLRQNPDKQALYSPFLQMGISLPEAVRGARHAVPDIKIIASGGVRNGLDIAKTLWLGADMAGMAGVLLQALEDKTRQLHPAQLSDKIIEIQEQLRLACFLTGVKKVGSLKKLPSIM